MIEPKKPPNFDIDGTDIMTDVLKTLLNQFPGNQGREIMFSTLGTTAGIAFFPDSGAVVDVDIKDILGNVHQECSYPFTLVYRAAPKSENQRLKIKEFMDTIGKWLEQQPVTLGDQVYQLTKYPELTDKTRVIKRIRRRTPGYLSGASKDGVEDWALSVNMQYNNDYTI